MRSFRKRLTRACSRAAANCSISTLAMSFAISFQSSPRPSRKFLAYHFTEAGLRGVALEWWRKAGQQALKRSAYSEAIAHLGKAVAIADELPDEQGRTMNRLHLQIAYGRALRGSLGHSAPETVAAWTRARRFAADINDPGELAPSHAGLFNACLTHGEIAPMRELAEAIMSAARRRRDSPVAAVLSHWTIGVTCWFGGDYMNALLHLEQGRRS